ncbi:MAG: hypothetical protein KJ718_01750 [Nanoarchaeota archaeon]|nr:hypothetical protein [Nanoarchaeota archaeon]
MISKRVKKRRREILIVIGVLWFVSAVMTQFSVFNQTIAVSILVGLTVALFTKVLDWWEVL